MPKLVTWMNNQRVGELTKLANGAHTFKYAPEWLANRYARPLSLSLPLQRGNNFKIIWKLLFYKRLRGKCIGSG